MFTAKIITLLQSRIAGLQLSAGMIYLVWIFCLGYLLVEKMSWEKNPKGKEEKREKRPKKGNDNIITEK